MRPSPLTPGVHAAQRETQADLGGCSPMTRPLASVSGNKAGRDVFVYQLGEVSSQTPSVRGRWIPQEPQARVIKRAAFGTWTTQSYRSLFVELPAFHVSGFTYISKGGKGQLEKPSSLTAVPAGP